MLLNRFDALRDHRKKNSCEKKNFNHQMLGDSIEPLIVSWLAGCRELHVESSALSVSELAEHMQRHAFPLSVFVNSNG